MKNEGMKDAGYYRGLRYGIALRKDEENDWIARVEELPGCVAHGESVAEALEHLEEIKTAWIDDAIESGETVPEPRPQEDLPSGKWLQRVPRSLHKGLAEIAAKEGVSLNQLVTTVLAEAVGRYQTGRGVVVVDDVSELGGWSTPRADWSHYQGARDMGVWQINPQKPVEFIFDALASKMCAIPDQLDEPQFRVIERVSKKELSYKS
ncbi:MAG: type II toxin-antitoxin system HicB family antitoxin [Terriglobales bacterium]|jgi:antitoxin HicB